MSKDTKKLRNQTSETGELGLTDRKDVPVSGGVLFSRKFYLYVRFGGKMIRQLSLCMEKYSAIHRLLLLLLLLLFSLVVAVTLIWFSQILIAII